MSSTPTRLRRHRRLVATGLLAVLVVSLAACGGSDDASRSGSKDAVDRQALFVKDVEMRFQNYTGAELSIDWQGKDGQQEPSWDTPVARTWDRNSNWDYIYDFPFRIILSNDGGKKTWVEVDTSNRIGSSPSVTVAGEKATFLEDQEITFSGPGWRLEVKREADDNFKRFYAKFYR